MNRVHKLPCCLLPTLILSSSRTSLQRPSSILFPHKNRVCILSSPINSTCPTHLIILDFITLITFEEKKCELHRASFFWDVMWRRLAVGGYRNFGATSRSHLEAVQEDLWPLKMGPTGCSKRRLPTTNPRRVTSQKNDGQFCCWCLLFYSFVLILIIPLSSSFASLYFSWFPPFHSLFTPVYFHLTFLYSSTLRRRFSPSDTVTKLQAERPRYHSSILGRGKRFVIVIPVISISKSRASWPVPFTV